MENEKIAFYKILLSLEENIFGENIFKTLSNSIDFEELGKGRKGNILVNPNNAQIPIVRTTTNYTKPAHIFSTSHQKLIENIKNVINSENSKFPNELFDAISFNNISFNNAMIEIYDQDYTKMGYHSDQCLDLENNSFIALFSCYEYPNELSKKHLRKLKIKNKATNEESELLLENNSLVLFSLETNTKFQHKIVLDYPNLKNENQNQDKKSEDKKIENKWLGITLRKSKTFIHFKDNLPYFPNGDLLELANETQKKEFFVLKGQENNNIDFVFPPITYTLSASDMLVPV